MAEDDGSGHNSRNRRSRIVIPPFVFPGDGMEKKPSCKAGVWMTRALSNPHARRSSRREAPIRVTTITAYNAGISTVMDASAIAMRKAILLSVVLSGLVAGCLTQGRPGHTSEADYGIGRPATEDDIRAADIDVPPSGEGLPPGQ